MLNIKGCTERQQLGAQETSAPRTPGPTCPAAQGALLSSILAWGVPWTEEPGGLLSMGLQSRKFNHFPIEGHLNCFPFLIVTSKCAINI